MSTPFQEAMQTFVEASNDYNAADSTRETEEAAKYLARAGDALESVLRQMMRDEVCKVVQESAIQ